MCRACVYRMGDAAARPAHLLETERILLTEAHGDVVELGAVCELALFIDTSGRVSAHWMDTGERVWVTKGDLADGVLSE